MRGYFAIGVEGISKPMNVGNLFRSAHAFGASFVFTIRADARAFNLPSDTSRSAAHLPAFHFASAADLMLPRGCRLVGIELMDEAIELPRFRHPAQAAYVLGPEMGSLSPQLVEKCDFLVKIPTRFCVNVGVAGAIVMYDRMLTLKPFGERPLHEGGESQPPAPAVRGAVFRRRPA